jgi:hypothetical protein
MVRVLFEGGLIPKNPPFGGGASGAVQFPANDGGAADPQYKMRKVRRTFSSRTKIPRCSAAGFFIPQSYAAYNLFFKNICRCVNEKTTGQSPAWTHIP